MPYCTQADLEASYGADEIRQLTDRAGTGSTDTGVVDAAIAAAGVEVDGFLAAKYTLPLATPSLLVQHLACEIARYRLWKDAAPERVRNGYTDAVARLKDLSSGVMRLTNVAGSEPAASTAAHVAVDAPIAVFDAAGMEGY